jgi:hypothetical protein
MNRLEIIKLFFKDMYPVFSALFSTIKMPLITVITRKIYRLDENFGGNIKNTKEEFQQSSLYLFQILILLFLIKKITGDEVIKEVEKLHFLNNFHALYLLFIIVSYPYLYHYISCFIKNTYTKPYASLSVVFYWVGYLFGFLLPLFFLSFLPLALVNILESNNLIVDIFSLIILLIGLVVVIFAVNKFMSHLYYFSIWISRVNKSGFFIVIISSFASMFLCGLMLEFLGTLFHLLKNYI